MIRDPQHEGKSMSEQTTIPGEVILPPPQPVITTAENDWFLQELVSMVNRTGNSIGITLFVGGVLVSGQLIGGKHYFDGFADTFAAGTDNPDDATWFKDMFSKLGDVYVEPDGTYKQDAELPHYIHLKDARTFHPSGNPIPGTGGVWWRGRIREVNGFNLGVLRVN